MPDDLGDRMKAYEAAEAGRRFMPLLPVVARLDGKNFSAFTRGLARPYDARLSALMAGVAEHLVRDTAACCGYTQSDEITLAWYSSDPGSQIYFDGRVQKMCSVLAAACAVAFNRRLPAAVPEKADHAPVFDCRVWQVPTLTEAANCFVWREQDAAKNSISMAARCYYSHRELDGKSGPEMQEMLFQKGVNWNDYPTFFKRGTYVVRRKVVGKFSAEDLEKLPPLHNARKTPNLVVERTEYHRRDLPRLTAVVNRTDVLFGGADPVTKPTQEEDPCPTSPPSS